MGRSNGYCSVTMFLGFCARKVTARPFKKSTSNNRSRSSRMRVSLFRHFPIVKQSAVLFLHCALCPSASIHSFFASSVLSVPSALTPFLLFLHAILSAEMDADLQFMQEALAEARASASAGEVPIGAVLVYDGKILARSGNRTIRDNDPTAHAEIIVLREAARLLSNYRLANTALYVTIEPCSMCAGAIIQARVPRLVYGADDPKGGAVRSCFEI